MDSKPSSHQYLKLLDIAVGNEDFPEPCLLEDEATAEPMFNYLRFMEYHNMCAHLPEAEKLEMFLIQEGFLTLDESFASVLENFENESQQNGACEVPTDEFIQDQLTSLYGPIDFKDEQMQESLKVVKETYLECNASKLDDRDDFCSIFDLFGLELSQYIEDCAGLIYGTQCMRIKDFLMKIIDKKFSKEEQLQYSSLDPSTSAGEWFIIPRLPLRKIRQTHFSNFYSNISKNSSYYDPCPKLLSNLHLYDPKFEFCFEMPYLFFNDGNEDKIDQIPKIVSLRLMEHLNKFPFGITMLMFWDTYYNIHGKFPYIRGIGVLNNAITYHSKEIFVAKLKFKNGYPDDLLFANYMEGVAHPELILKRVWHAVRHLMAEKKFVETIDIFKLIRDRYHFDFNPLHWGFATRHEFLVMCAKRFGPSELVHYRVEIIGEKVIYRDYFMIKSETLRQEIKKLNGIEENRISKRLKSVPDGYLGNFATIDYISNHLQKDSVELSDLRTMYHPYNMTLVLLSCCRELKYFQRDLQQDFSVKQAAKLSLVIEDVMIGMYALVNTTWGKRTEWYRVKVVKRHDDNEFEIYAIDHGFLKKVPVQDIKFMPYGYVSNEKAYAIPVQLKIVHPSRKQNAPWEVYATDVMYRIVDGHVLSTTFLCSEPDETTGCLKWTVMCNLVNISKSEQSAIPALNVIDPTVNLSIIFYNKFEQKRIDKRNKRAKKCQESNAEVPQSTETEENSINEQMSKLEL